MKVFVTGVGGQLGYDVMNELANRGHECVGSDILPKEKIALPFEYMQLDITDKAAVEQTISKLQPDAVIHCAAWTAVDAAEVRCARCAHRGVPCALIGRSWCGDADGSEIGSRCQASDRDDQLQSLSRTNEIPRKIV